MAEKRMISKRVFLSNGFHRISNGAKALYVMLALHSDDDGFSNSAAICEAFLGVDDEALFELIRGGFVLWFEEEGVALITHWKQQNCLKNERVGKLSYPGIAKRIFVHQNGTYSLERGEDGVSFGSYKECLYRYGREAAEGMLKCATDGSIIERGAAAGPCGGVSTPVGVSAFEATVTGQRSAVGTVGNVGNVGRSGDCGTEGGNSEIKTDEAGRYFSPCEGAMQLSIEKNGGKSAEDEIINYVSSEMREAEPAFFGGGADVFSGKNDTFENFSPSGGKASESDVTIHNFLGNPGEKNGKEEKRTESFYAAEAAVARARAAASATDSERDTVLSFFSKNGGYSGDETSPAGDICPRGGGCFPAPDVVWSAVPDIGASIEGKRSENGGEISLFSEMADICGGEASAISGNDGGVLSDNSVISGDDGGVPSESPDYSFDDAGGLSKRRSGSAFCPDAVGELSEKREILRESGIDSSDPLLCGEDEVFFSVKRDGEASGQSKLRKNDGALRSDEKTASGGKISGRFGGFDVLSDDNSGEYEVCRDGRFLRRYDGRIFRLFPADDGSSGDLLLPVDRLIDLPGAKNDSERLEAFLAKEEGYSDADFRISPIGGLGRGVVMLSEVQIGRLLRELSLEEFDHYVSRLAEFIEKNHPTVKNHYKTILRWAREDRAIDA